MTDSEQFQPYEWYSLECVLQTPAQISCLASGHAGHIFAGSADGSLRVYDLSSSKVIKAVQQLGGEISSVICVKRPGSELRDAWLACGTRIMKFQMDSPKMIQTAEDALVVIDVGDSMHEDDVLNELSINSNKSYIAFSMDSGIVGVVDLASKTVKRMKTKHTSICGTVKFIPERPREIVSGGYDTALIHFDFHEGKVLSTRKFPAFTVLGSTALSPPFIMSTAIIPNGIIAATTADGRLMIGCGGLKSHKKGSKKKSRKWEGLNDEHIIADIAQGPIVALSLSDSGKLTMSTLLGVLTRYEVVWDEDEGSVELEKAWQQETQVVKKVNTLIVNEKRIVVGGLTADGRGAIEIWKEDTDYTAYALPIRK